MKSSRNHIAFTFDPCTEPSETYADLLARLEARDAEIVKLNQRMAALEKSNGHYPSTEQDGIGRNTRSSAINPIFEGEGDIAVNIEYTQVPDERGRWYFAKLISVGSTSSLN